MVYQINIIISDKNNEKIIMKVDKTDAKIGELLDLIKKNLKTQNGDNQEFIICASGKQKDVGLKYSTLKEMENRPLKNLLASLLFNGRRLSIDPNGWPVGMRLDSSILSGRSGKTEGPAQTYNIYVAAAD